MKIRDLHDWDVTYKEAVSIQQRLKQCLVLRDDGLPDKFSTVGGADISYDRGSSRFFAAVIVLSWPDLKILEESCASADISFPYIPGLLSFREGPPLLAAFEKLRSRLDVVLFDGQGIAHPRGVGLASHMGLWLDVPTIGCAKKKLFGDYLDPGPTVGEWSPLQDEEHVIGVVLRTKSRVKPVFVSQGHRISLERASRIVLSTTAGYRIPEPVRQAHLAVNRHRQSHRDSIGRR